MERGFGTVMRVKGAPIRLHWTLPIGAFVFGGFAFAPAFWLGFVTLVLAHELGHAVIAWRYGHAVESIDITGLGGRCTWQSGEATRYERGAVAWGGVLAQAAILALALILVSSAKPLESIIALELSRAFVTVNLVLIAVNLLPMAPLDGAEAWPWLAERYHARRELDETRRLTLIEGVSPSIEPPASALATSRMVTAPVVRKAKSTPPPPRVEPVEVPEPREAYRSDAEFAALLKHIAEEAVSPPG